MKITYDSSKETVTITDTFVPPVVVPPIVIPPPVVVPPSTFPVINLQPFVAGSGGLDALTFYRYTTFNRYERNQTLLDLKPSGGSLHMIAVKMFNGAALTVNGPVGVTMTPVSGAPVALAATMNGSQVDVLTPNLLPGWYRLTATASLPVPAYYAFVPGGPPPATMPVVRANWEMEHSNFVAADCMVPAVFAPVTVPYPARVFENTTAIPSRATCVETQLVPCRAPDVYRLTYASTTAQQPEGGAYSPRQPGVAGVATTANRQCYNYFDLIGREVPMLPLLDGPRGKGNVFAAQHLSVGRNGKILGTDNWRKFRIDSVGAIKTIVGWRHKTPTLWTDAPQDLELVGNWALVQGAKGFNECWGGPYDARTLEIDLAAPLVDGEPPHKGLGPVDYLPDRNHKRILRTQANGGGPLAAQLFGNTDRDAPVIVTEWISSNEPWECVTDGTNRLFVSERADRRIAIYSMDDRTLLQSWPMPASFPFPEGLFYQDGALYYACVSTDASGQLTGGQIRKRTDGGADSLVIQLTTPWIIDNNSRFAKIALSDGTFGPRGMIALATWSGNNYGYPLLFTPNGASKVSDSLFPGQQGQAGPGLPWQVGSAYPTAMGFGLGRMVCSTMQEGLRVISKAQATDTNLATPGYIAGRAEYMNKAYNLTNGDNGWGLYGLPHRFGVSAAMDEYLHAHGH